MNTIDRRKQALLKNDLKEETWPPKSPKPKRKYHTCEYHHQEGRGHSYLRHNPIIRSVNSFLTKV